MISIRVEIEGHTVPHLKAPVYAKIELCGLECLDTPRSHRPFRFEHWWTRPNFFEMYSRNIDKSLYLNEIWIYGPLFCTLFLPGFEPGTSRVAAGSANHYTNVERAGRAKKLLIMKFCVTCHWWITDWAITKILISTLTSLLAILFY